MPPPPKMKLSLKAHLNNRRLTLLEDIDELKTKIMYGCDGDDDRHLLDIKEAQLNEIKSVIEICGKRSRY